ncbi:hypothetical protein ACWDBF_21200 [Streptomyces angustmyceticus]
MLGVIAVTDVLAMATPDDDDTADCYRVRDILDHKRRSPHYATLVEEIRRDGIELPVMIRTRRGRPWLVDGHHRVAAAIDLGISHLVWSDLPLEVEDRPHSPVMGRGWGSYRPAA